MRLDQLRRGDDVSHRFMRLRLRLVCRTRRSRVVGRLRRCRSRPYRGCRCPIGAISKSRPVRLYQYRARRSINATTSISSFAVRQYGRSAGRDVDFAGCRFDLILRPLHQLRQLRHVDRDPAGFVAREKIGSGASARLILIIDVTERSPVGIADNETRAVVVNRPRGREMTGGHRPDHANEP